MLKGHLLLAMMEGLITSDLQRVEDKQNAQAGRFEKGAQYQKKTRHYAHESKKIRKMRAKSRQKNRK